MYHLGWSNVWLLYFFPCFLFSLFPCLLNLAFLFQQKFSSKSYHVTWPILSMAQSSLFCRVQCWLVLKIVIWLFSFFFQFLSGMTRQGEFRWTMFFSYEFLFYSAAIFTCLHDSEKGQLPNAQFCLPFPPFWCKVEISNGKSFPFGRLMRLLDKMFYMIMIYHHLVNLNEKGLFCLVFLLCMANRMFVIQAVICSICLLMER